MSFEHIFKDGVYRRFAERRDPNALHGLPDSLYIFLPRNSLSSVIKQMFSSQGSDEMLAEN